MSVFEEKEKKEKTQLRTRFNLVQLGLGRGYFCCKHFLNKNE